MLKAAVVEVVREEVRAALHGQPTVQSVLEDMGFLIGSLSREDAVTFAKIALRPLADLIDASTPAEEPEPETTGAEGTGEEEE